MIENDNANFQILTNMLIEKNDKDYLIIIASNKSLDFAIILVQESSYVYCKKYVLEDFKKINFFKNFIGFGIKQCIDIMIDLLKQKKNLINLEEEENVQIILSLDIELSVDGININLPKERIEFKLKNDNAYKDISNILIWRSVLYLFKEKDDDEKKIKEQENKIKQLSQEIYDLKQNLVEQNNNNKNDLNKSKILNEYNIKSFDFVKKRLKLISSGKKLNFLMLYSGTMHGDKSQKFHELCDNHKNTLILIKTNSNIIFGGFAGKTWNSVELGRKKDIKSFLFSFEKQKIYNPKIEESKYHLYCSDNDGPCFYAFSIDNYFLQNGGFCDEIYKCNYDSFEKEYELNNCCKNFKIEELEIYSVKFI